MKQKLKFRVWGLEGCDVVFRVYMVYGLWFMVWGLGFRFWPASNLE
jgi:hypothetical protein